MTVYRWAMRNGAPILFFTSLLVFVVSLASQFVTKWSILGGTDLTMEAGQGPGRLWFLLATLVQAISNSATIFAAACIVYLLDRRFGDGE